MPRVCQGLQQQAVVLEAGKALGRTQEVLPWEMMPWSFPLVEVGSPHTSHILVPAPWY
jgi:hypothetical protein